MWDCWFPNSFANRMLSRFWILEIVVRKGFLIQFYSEFLLSESDQFFTFKGHLYIFSSELSVMPFASYHIFFFFFKNFGIFSLKLNDILHIREINFLHMIHFAIVFISLKFVYWFFILLMHKFFNVVGEFILPGFWVIG